MRMPLQGPSERIAAGLRNSAAAQWFRSQSHRDQRILKLLGAFLVVVGVWLLLWVPMRDALAVARISDAVGFRLSEYVAPNALHDVELRAEHRLVVTAEHRPSQRDRGVL